MTDEEAMQLKPGDLVRVQCGGNPETICEFVKIFRLPSPHSSARLQLRKVGKTKSGALFGVVNYDSSRVERYEKTATNKPLPMVGERAEWVDRSDRCETCKWWVADEEKQGIGLGSCHRFPPIASIYDAIICAINARDAFRNRPLKDQPDQAYKFDAEYSQPYTSIRQDEFVDSKDRIFHVGDSHSWPETWGEDFCGEWEAK